MHKQTTITLLTRADDCGSSIGANEGCYQAARVGFIKNISLMAVGPRIEEAAKQMAQCTDICFGLHFTMNAEWDGVKWKPLSAPESVPSLIDKQGYFYPDTTFQGTMPHIDEIKIEWYAQLQRLRDLGFTIRYADTHMFPELKIAGLQEEMSKWIQDEHLIDARYFYKPLPFMDDFAHVDGLFEKILPNLSPKQYYYLCHPVTQSEDMLDCYNVRNPKGNVRDKRNRERVFVTSEKTLDTLSKNHIVPIRYDEAIQIQEQHNSLTRWRNHEDTRGYTMRVMDVDTYAIDDIFGNHMYLIEGSEKAALIDTGMGVPGLSTLIQEVCQKPILVLHTHGHLDHIGASGEFEQGYLHEDDLLVFQKHASASYRTGIVQHFLEKTAFPFQEEELTFMRNGACVELFPFPKNGMIDLGNRKLQVISTPGHTQGSVCFLDKERNYLFSGDTVVDKGIMLSFPESSTPTAFKETLSSLLAKCPEDIEIYGGHHRVPVKKDRIQEYITLLEQIENAAIIGHIEDGTFGEQVMYQGEHLCITSKP